MAADICSINMTKTDIEKMVLGFESARVQQKRPPPFIQTRPGYIGNANSASKVF
jgi:hypothetical protein